MCAHIHERAHTRTHAHGRRLKQLAAGSEKAAAEGAQPPWQSSEAVLGLVAEDPVRSKKRKQHVTKHERLTAIRRVLTQY